MRLVLAGVFAVMGLASQAVWGASFDCKLAKTAQEKAICATPALSKADEDMAAAYKAVTAAVPVEMKPEVLAEQRGWVKGVAKTCKAGDASLAACLQGVYLARIKDLKGRVVTKNGVTFVMHAITLMAKDAEDESSPDIREGEENPGFGTMHAQWPEALSSEPEWKTWNTAAMQEAQKLARTDEKQPLGEWKTEWAAGMESQVTATMVSVGQGRVSVRLEEDIMGHGAAHPSESWESFHWLLKEQRALAVEDVFAAGSGWAAVVNARCMAGLVKQFGKDGLINDNPAGTVAEVTASVKNWGLTATGLVISFPEYTVSPRAAPADDVTVPWSVLKPYLATGFVMPQ